jgi:hypothetical protein
MKMANTQFSHGTLNPTHLLQISIPWLKHFGNEELLQRVEVMLETNDDTDYQIADLWIEVFDYLDTHSAEDYYFGSSVGDGSDIGWWPTSWL